VLTDVNGATMLDGLWAAGEVADVGVHGANRLASNSLLEGMVFGARLAEAIEEGARSATPSGVLRGLIDPDAGGLPATAVEQSQSIHEATEVREDLEMPTTTSGKLDLLQTVMSRHAGVVRSAEGLAEAIDVVASLTASQPRRPSTVGEAELANVLLSAGALLDAAAQREESRGCHVRAEFSDRDPAWERRIIRGGGW